MILAKLKGYREWRNCKYCKGKKYRTTAVPKRVPMQEEYVIFKDLRKEVKKPIPPARERVTWISEATWGLEDQSNSLKRIHLVEQQELRTTKRHF